MCKILVVAALAATLAAACGGGSKVTTQEAGQTAPTATAPPKEEDSSRCEEATVYLAAASVTAYEYTQMIAFNLGTALHYGDPAKRAEAAAVFLSGVQGDTDDFSRLRVPAGFEQFRDHLVETGQEVARGMKLVSEQQIDEAAGVFLALGEPVDVLQYLPEWVFQCPEPSQ